MDEDLDQMSREELIAEVKKLRQGFRRHRASTGHELCWHHPAFWGLLTEKQDLCQPSQSDRSFSVAAFATASRSMNSYLMPLAHARNIKYKD